MNVVNKLNCPECGLVAHSYMEYLQHLKIVHPNVDLKDVGPIPTKSILEEAQEIIYGDREKTYGDPSLNLQRIAHLWNSYLHGLTIALPGLGTPALTINDIANMMILLKVARLINDPTHRDSKVDIAGYAALMQRCIDSGKDSQTQAAVNANLTKGL